MRSKITIHGIDCYGKFEETSNVVVIGDWADGSEMEEIWCNDTEESSWTGAVRELKGWADRNGYIIYELGAC